MAKFITRTIVSSTIVLGELNKDSKDIDAIGTLPVSGKIDEEKALKIVRKAFPTRNVLVLDIIPNEGQYRMLETDFIANAEKVEVAEVSQEEAEVVEA